MLDTLAPWPPEYTVRKSKRAKYIRLSVSAKGVEVVLPHACAYREADTMLQSKREWVQDQLRRFASEKPIIQDTELNDVFLRAVDQLWTIHYVADAKRTRLLQRENSTLVLFGDIEDKQRCQALVIDWIKKRAKQILIPWLTELSLEHDLPFNDVTIRGQSTRWGSCSSEKNINLNYKLLFLPERLVEHILLHELCHTKHMDHSERFWNRLQQLDPHCDLMEKQSRRAQKYVPRWVE
tara:strand:+ start:65787 stop:66497 length:711 start_codon:yes stop_codon:yes gene_type:complete